MPAGPVGSSEKACQERSETAKLKSRSLHVVEEKRTAAEVDAVLAFKLVCNHLDISHWRMTPRRDKFKAICLIAFAFAVLDARQANRKAQQDPDEPTADSAVGVYLEVIVR